jgi:hypothetical protein
VLKKGVLRTIFTHKREWLVGYSTMLSVARLYTVKWMHDDSGKDLEEMSVA